MSIKKQQFLPGEKWAVLHNHKSAYGDRYAISNHGRLIKFIDKLNTGTFLKGSLQEGYPIWRFKKNGQYGHFLIHRLVAKYFLPTPSRLEKIVIHLNFKKKDNHYKNLKWVTMEESIAHQQKSPIVKKARAYQLKNISKGLSTAKLDEVKVKSIKTLIAKGNTLKEIASKCPVHKTVASKVYFDTELI